MDKAEGSSKVPSGHSPGVGSGAPGDEPDSTIALLRAIETEFRLAAARPEQVEAACARLRERMASPPTPQDLADLARLAPLLRERVGPIAASLFSLLEEKAGICDAPWTLLEGMLRARDRDLAHRAVRLAGELAGRGSLAVTPGVVERLALCADAEDSPLSESAALSAMAGIVRRLKVVGAEAEDPVRTLYLEGEGRLRRLAARILDLDGQPPGSSLAVRLLGPGAHEVLGPYLDYTRATHLDLLCLAPAGGEPPPIVAALRRAETECGEALLREVVADLGWPRVNLGLEIRRVLGVSLGGSFPFMVSPWEAPLLESLEGARRVSGAFLFVAHGGEREEGPKGGADDGPVARFRAYNLLHAEVLSDILDIAPLTGEKTRRVLGRMDAVVGHFSALFRPFTDEASLLEGVYGDLKEKILSELEGQSADPRLSAELTRLVQAFEDPRSLGEVRTLHGLKRYLHQRGLHLAFRLVEAGGATNRTVDLVAASPKRVLRRGKGIRYVDFEPSATKGAEGWSIPYPVAVVAEEFGRQLLHGQESFPGVRVFCYGNEVHYYLAYANHPAFLRIDYSPPLLGGMIDLEYFGVSKYDLSAHPDPSLEAICRFFRDLEFDALSESTRVHARYDKERALDLGDLCEKVEALFRLVPYLMEADWVIGGLDLDDGARRKVTEAWARSFALWGVLPLGRLLTRDRRGILVAVESGPSGEREIPWSGQGPYRDRFAPVPRGLFAALRASLKNLGLDAVATLPEGGDTAIGQIGLERFLLRPLREALARGEVVATPEGLRPRSADLFEREDEAARFAGILESGDEEVAAAARLARLVAPLERSLRFRTTGSVNGHEAQQARLTLRGGAVALFVLRDAGGMIRLALYARGETLYRSREDPSGPWVSGGGTDAARLASLLRANSYLTPGVESAAVAADEDPRRIREIFRRESHPGLPPPLPGEKVVSGLRASPGRAVGRALFRTAGRKPEDFDGAVLVAPFLRPEDNTCLFHSAGVASTGGGILSHAGLIAVQFRKPALIIPGRWQTEPDGSLTLLYRTLEYREEAQEMGGFRVSLRRDVREREHRLREGDLVALDADEGTLRALGQDRDTLALHEGLRLLGDLGRRLAGGTGEAEVLGLRGRRLRARYQVEKLLGRLADPGLARHLVHEILLGDALSESGGGGGRTDLLSLVLRNERIASPARDHFLHIIGELARRRLSAVRDAEERIPTSSSLYEVLSMRLGVLRLQKSLEEASLCAGACGLAVAPSGAAGCTEVEIRALRRVTGIAEVAREAVQAADSGEGGGFGLRHSLRQLDRLERVLGNPESDLVRRVQDRLAGEDEAALRRVGQSRVLGPADGGFELFPLIGWKAANLAEVERLGGSGLVPAWFVVTDRAFAEVLDAELKGTAASGEALPPGCSTLREGIGAILRRTDIGDTQKSVLIRGLWEAAVLPEALSAEVAEAYSRLARETAADGPEEEDRSRPFVAIRSSAREEDAEAAARAGEFETFLFVRGEQAVLDHLKRAWSGLWTERAIHNRAVLGEASRDTGGGVIVQRIAWSRVSGVLQTVNVAEGEVREMVVNAGLGLGEGIVSGTVGADHVVVSKEGDLDQGPLRFRYITGDKQGKVVYNRQGGLGTVRVESLYHQRLRPALEYVELSELVRTAARLEAAYGYPLDIEFGIEGSRLWILQVRPVATFLSVLGETLERYPLSGARRRAFGPPAKEIRS